MSLFRNLTGGIALSMVLAACASAVQTDTVEPSAEATAYLNSVGEIQSRIEAGFEAVGDALGRSYPTREVLFSAIHDVGYQGIGATALSLAEELTPPASFETDHADWVAHRTLATEVAPELTLAIEGGDLQAMLGVFTRIDQDWAALLEGTSRDFCLAITTGSALCPAPDDLPGGDYGAEVYETLRINTLSTFGFFNFFGDMSPEERSLRLHEVQPRIEASLKAGGEAMKAIDPPADYEREHQALITYFEDQYATAVAITAANADLDDARIRELFGKSNVTFETAQSAMSLEYREIAAPWMGDG